MFSKVKSNYLIKRSQYYETIKKYPGIGGEYFFKYQSTLNLIIYA